MTIHRNKWRKYIWKFRFTCYYKDENSNKVISNVIFAGCPLTQAIQDDSTASAHGDGLAKGEEDKTSTFIVDTQGRRGDLNVTVEGPNSVAKVLTNTKDT